MIAAHRARKSTARIYDGFPIRNWDHWIDEKQVRIFVQALDEEGQPSGAPRDLLAGTRLAASPGFAGRQTDTGEEIEVEFTPDNKAIVFAATTNLDQAARAFTDSQLFVVDVTGGEPRAITTGLNSWSWPQFTPDGRTPAGPGRAAGRQRLQRRASRGLPVAGAGRTTHRHRRHRSRR